MPFVKLTRPNGTPVYVQSSAVIKFAPVPEDGPTAGPLKTGTRLELANKEHQDVKELHEEVNRLLAER